MLSAEFEDLRTKTQKKSRMSDCSLLIGGMDIKKNYNTAQEKHVGFVDYGDMIPRTSEHSLSLTFIVSEH